MAGWFFFLVFFWRGVAFVINLGLRGFFFLFDMVCVCLRVLIYKY